MQKDSSCEYIWATVFIHFSKQNFKIIYLKGFALNWLYNSMPIEHYYFSIVYTIWIHKCYLNATILIFKQLKFMFNY